MVVVVALFIGLIFHSVLASDEACSHPWTIIGANNGTTTVGHCIVTFIHLYTTLYTASNVSTLNDAMCGSLHRTGQMCGGCEKSYAPPVYSYSLTCVDCFEYKYYHWLKFIAIALLPLTIFYIAVVILRISALSPNLDVLILLCQLISAPWSMRVYSPSLPSSDFLDSL